MKLIWQGFWTVTPQADLRSTLFVQLLLCLNHFEVSYEICLWLWLVKRQPAFYPHTDANSNRQDALKSAAFPSCIKNPLFPFFFLSKSDILFAFCSVLTLCSPDCYFSVQQCPSEHEDSAAEPDSPNGELGTPSDRLPPAYHQLHRLLQLGQTWRGRWKHLHQDWRPEHGEYWLLELMTRSDWCTQTRLAEMEVMPRSGGDKLWWTLRVSAGW